MKRLFPRHCTRRNRGSCTYGIRPVVVDLGSEVSHRQNGSWNQRCRMDANFSRSVKRGVERILFVNNESLIVYFYVRYQKEGVQGLLKALACMCRMSRAQRRASLHMSYHASQHDFFLAVYIL